MNVDPVSIASIRAPSVAADAPPSVARPAASGVPFAQLMSDFLHEADQQQHAVTLGVDQLMTGEADNIHDLAITIAQADIAFRLVMEVRDKLISAYQEVMRMQV
jgi:flagellar hook-basal body complex protein FliE